MRPTRARERVEAVESPIVVVPCHNHHLLLQAKQCVPRYLHRQSARLREMVLAHSAKGNEGSPNARENPSFEVTSARLC